MRRLRHKASVAPPSWSLNVDGLALIVEPFVNLYLSDGGAGMLQALGGQLLDAQGKDLPKAGGAASLLNVASIRLDSIHPKLRKDSG